MQRRDTNDKGLHHISPGNPDLLDYFISFPIPQVCTATPISELSVVTKT